MTQPMKVFVAGGTGVLGRAALKSLIEAGHHVRATARGSDKAALARRLGAEPVEVDLYDPAAVRRAIKGSDAVLRLTAKIGSFSEIRRAKAWEETNRLRTEGARVLVDTAIAEGVKVYVNESVAFVYRDGGTKWLDEDAPTDDTGTPILAAALQGEQEAARFARAGGRGIVLRFGGFYGPDVPSSQEMLAMARKRMLAQVGPGSNYFSSIYVSDAGSAVAGALQTPGGVYNVCDDDPISFADYVRTAADAAGAPKPLHVPGFLGPLLFGTVWKYLSRSLRVSNAKLKTTSTWTPQVESVRADWRKVTPVSTGTK
jgi:nucleoside-diphosphate-sugar epimerase